MDPSKTIGTLPKLLLIYQNHSDSPKSFGIHKRTRHRIAKIFFAIFMLRIALQINYWKTKYKPQAEHSIKCPLFSAVKCNLTKKIKDHFHKFSNTDDQNRNMFQFYVNLTGAKHCKVFCLPFSVFSQLLKIFFHPTKTVKILVIGIWGFVKLLCIWFYPLVYSIHTYLQP